MADIYEGLEPTKLHAKEYQPLFSKTKKFVIENHPEVKPKDQNRFAMDLMGQGYPYWDKAGNVTTIDDPKGYARLVNGVTLNPDGSMKKGSWKARKGRQKTQQAYDESRVENLKKQTVGEANFPKAKPGSGIDVHHKHWTALYGEPFKGLKGKQLTELKLYAKNTLGLDLGDKEANAAFLPSDKSTGLTTENKPHAKIHKFLESPIEPGSKKTYRKFFQEFLGKNPSLDQRKKALSLMKHAVQMPADRELMGYMQDFASKNHSLYRTLYQDQLFDPTKKISSINGAGTNLRKSYNETTQIAEGLYGNGNGNGLNGRNGRNGLSNKVKIGAGGVALASLNFLPSEAGAREAQELFDDKKYTEAIVTLGTDLVVGDVTGRAMLKATTTIGNKLAQKGVKKLVARKLIVLAGRQLAKKGLALAAGPAAPALLTALILKDVYDIANVVSRGRLNESVEDAFSSVKTSLNGARTNIANAF
tara:strand:- start:3570 stop:4994 length:1425 start_codon:yes stop_codon:yes gene_type:complete